MTTFATNTTDLATARPLASTSWRAVLSERLSAVAARFVPNPEKEIARAARRADARRAVDHLLR